MSMLKPTKGIFRETVSTENTSTDSQGYFDALLLTGVLSLLVVVFGQCWSNQVHKCYSAHENFHDFCSCCSTCLHRRHESCTAVKAALFYHLAYKHWKSRGGITHRFHKKQNLCLCNFIWLKDKHRCCICRYDIYNAILSIMFCFKDGKTLSIYLS